MRYDSHEFYKKRQKSGICKKILWLSTGRRVSTIHLIRKILFDEIDDFVFQVDITTSLAVDRQREKSHDSAPMCHSVVEYFFNDCCVNFFWVVTISIDANTHDRVQLEKILPSGLACLFDNSFDQCTRRASRDNFFHKQVFSRYDEQLMQSLRQHLERE